MTIINKLNLEFREGIYMHGNSSWLWPKEDNVCWDYFNIHEYQRFSSKNIQGYHLPNDIMNFVPDFRRKVIIQAGGNSGLYPAIYSNYFEKVITFEPDYRWFFCLNFNASSPNIYKYQAAIGNDNNPVDMVTPTIKGGTLNLGGLHISPNGSIPKIKIDSLGLNPDLIHLDIEGAEWDALLGASETIIRSKPIIVVEWDTTGEKYGWTKDKAEQLFLDFDYVLYNEWPRDRAYIHKSQL
jgi:FkbM family methyltransferase